MKELSIEEKARRYDEVFSAAKEWYNNPNSSSIGKSYLYAVLPELKESKESEDERIRKDIVAAVETYGNFTQGRKEEIYNWLEKQGKNNMGISEATKQKLEDNLNKALEKETPESWNKFLEKQGEQKPAWSEEDEEMCQETIDWFERKCFPYALESENPARESIKWLKSLKDRVQPQPKQEWSEEDEKIYNLLYEEYKNVAYYSRSREKAEDIAGEVLGWLKSIKERYTWKPSDKQMEAVRIAAEIGTANNSWAMGILKDMHQDLKKLMEE